jgi:hypothetical protein
MCPKPTIKRKTYRYQIDEKKPLMGIKGTTTIERKNQRRCNKKNT